jgi:flagellar assembly factor FliW
MRFDVVIPIDGFENEKEFIFTKIDDFFSIIKSVESNKELRLMSFGALKSLAFEFPEDFISKLEIKDISDISIFYIFVLQNTTSTNSLNTFSPIILNHKSSKMGQIHLDLNDLGLESLNDLLPNF